MKDGENDYSAYTYEQVIEGLENILPEEYPINAANLRKRLAEVAQAPPPPRVDPPMTPADLPTVLGAERNFKRPSGPRLPTVRRLSRDSTDARQR